jgi:hypothetical protein
MTDTPTIDEQIAAVRADEELKQIRQRSVKLMKSAGLHTQAAYDVMALLTLLDTALAAFDNGANTNFSLDAGEKPR